MSIRRRQREELSALRSLLATESGLLEQDPSMLVAHLHDTLVLSGEPVATARLRQRAVQALGDRSSLHLRAAGDTPRRRGNLRRLLMADGGTTTVAWSPDGSLVASGAYTDGCVSVWSARTGRLITREQAHTGPITALSWCPVDDRLVSAGHDGLVCLWRRPGSVDATLRGHTDLVGAVSWAPDGRRFATASDDRTVRIWSTERGSCERILAAGPGRVETGWTLTSGSPARDRVDRGAEAFREGRLEDAERLFAEAVALDPANSTVCGNLAVLRIRQGRAAEAIPWARRALALDPAVPGGEETLRRAEDASSGRAPVEDADYRRLAVPVTVGGHGDYVRALAWSPDGTLIASGGYDRTVRLWPVDEDREAVVLSAPGAVFGVAWSPEQRHLASVGDDGALSWWEVPIPLSAPVEPVHVAVGHDGPVLCVACRPDGSSVATGGDDGTVRSWTPSTGDHALIGAHPKPVHDVSWSPGADLLASAGGEGAVRIWSAPRPPTTDTGAPPARIWQASWSPDASFLASAHDDGVVRVWDPAGNLRGELHGHVGPAFAVRWASDHTTLVSGGHDGTLRVWHPFEDAPLVATVEIDEPGEGSRGDPGSGGRWTSAIAVAPDGTSVAAGRGDGRVQLVTTRDGSWVLDRELPAGEAMVRGLSWSPDGRLLAIADLAATAIVDVATGQRALGEVATERTDPSDASRERGVDPTLDDQWDTPGRSGGAWVDAVAWSPDGGHLAGGGEDGVLQVWDADGTSVWVTAAHRLPIGAVAWSPDGTHLATGGRDRTVKVWDVRRRLEVAKAHGLAAIVDVAFHTADRLLVTDVGATTSNRPVPYDYDLRLGEPSPAPADHRPSPGGVPVAPRRPTPPDERPLASVEEALAEARREIERNDHAAAVVRLVEVLRVSPRHPLANHLLAAAIAAWLHDRFEQGTPPSVDDAVEACRSALVAADLAATDPNLAEAARRVHRTLDADLDELSKLPSSAEISTIEELQGAYTTMMAAVGKGAPSATQVGELRVQLRRLAMRVDAARGEVRSEQGEEALSMLRAAIAARQGELDAFDRTRPLAEELEGLVGRLSGHDPESSEFSEALMGVLDLRKRAHEQSEYEGADPLRSEPSGAEQIVQACDDVLRQVGEALERREAQQRGTPAVGAWDALHAPKHRRQKPKKKKSRWRRRS